MENSIHPKIKKIYENTFLTLSNVIQIKIFGIPDKTRYCLNVWACLIKSVDVVIKVLPENSPHFVLDKFSYSLQDRFLDLEFNGASPIKNENNEMSFEIIPPEFLKVWKPYLQKLQKKDVSFQIEMEINFNSIEGIFLWNKKDCPDFSTLQTDVKIIEPIEEIIQKMENNSPFIFI